MCKRLVFLISMLVSCLGPGAQAATIIWVSDNKTPTAGVAADQAWVDLLIAQGYTINLDFRNKEARTLDAAKLAVFNAADLIIISRDLNSGDYGGSAAEILQWNTEIKKPLLSLMAIMARNTDRWKWLQGTAGGAQPLLQAVKLDHPIFAGVTLDANNQVGILTANCDLNNAGTAGNGTLIAKRADNSQVWIAEWAPGVEFYAGAGQVAGGRRMLFPAGGTGPDGKYNFNATGQKMFLNAVRYMLGDAGTPGLATAPNPADKATDVPHDVTLSWTAGQFAATHDVYVGLSAADVNTATRTKALGVLAGQDQNGAGYVPAHLQFGQTYYWRVDEVNAPPGTGIVKGKLWSFTVEPYAYPILRVTATASSAQPDMGPENTVNGSGLDKNDRHGTQALTMWMSAGAQPWIQYQFEKVCKLQQMLVWNSNQLIEGVLGMGARKVTIEYSTDGTAWKTLANVPELARAPGADGYAANTTVNFGGVDARFVKLTINSNWGGLAPQAGLSEVRFFYVPVQARLPQPANAAAGVKLDTTLGWRPGRPAASHQVYFGADPNAVAHGTAAARTVTDHSCAPGVLNLGTTYYWRVDEVNAGTVPGDVWSFTTEAYKVVDDFEGYTDKAGNEVFSAWVDGYADNHKTNGSTVGLTTAKNGTYGETTIVHGGKQSMPLAYDNTQVALSEAARTFDKPQDWTASGIQSLSLWFQGTAGNSGRLYLKIDNTKVPYDGAAANLAKPVWIPWNIDLSKATGVNKVTSLTIGIEGNGAKGTLYIDDIRLYPKTPEYLTPADPGPAHLAAQYTFEGNVNDSSGHGLNGTLKQGTLVLSGRPDGGSALKIGKAGYVDLGNPPTLDFGSADWAVTAWFKTAMAGTGDANQGTICAKGGDSTGGKRYALVMNATTEGVLSLVTDDDVNKYTVDSKSKTNDDQWHFAVGQRQGAALQIYIDGQLESTLAIPAAYNLAGTSQRDAYIGASTNQPDGSLYKLFSGLIDDVRIYQRALSAGEVLWLAGQTTPAAQPF